MSTLNTLAKLRTSIKTTTVLACALTGCSDSTSETYPSVEVEVGPLICVLTDDDGGIAPVQVNCKVVVGNVSESAEGVAISVDGIMGVYALPEVCGDFGPGEQDSKQFGAAVAEALAAAYAKAKSDWIIESVKCE